MKFLGRNISREGYMKKNKKIDISRSSNYSSERYRKWDWLIYLAREITRTWYDKNPLLEQDILILIDFWNFSLKKLLERDIWKNEKNDISRSSNYLSEIYRKWDCLIYQKWDCLIYLARVITRARYIKNGFGWYILLDICL